MVNASELLSFGSSGEQQFYTEEFYTTGTQNWTVPADVSRILVSVLGGGGSGGGGGGAYYRGGGGGGGGYCDAIVNVVPAQIYTVVVGAGGAAQASSSGTFQGITGGSSSFSGNGINLVGGGGQGGGGQGIGPNPATGGTASGGDTNYTGGDGGMHIDTSNPASGGGSAAHRFGIGVPGADATGSLALGGVLDQFRLRYGTPPFEYPGLFGTLPYYKVEGGLPVIGDFLGYSNGSTSAVGVAGGAGRFGANDTQGRNGDIGGGGGGAVAYEVGRTATSGKGGDGMVAITYVDPNGKFSL